MTVSQADIVYLRDLVYKRSAIVLESDKDYLVEARLGPIAREEGCADVASLISLMRKDTAPRLPTKVVEAMTTNETTFFRDTHPFDALTKKLIPTLLKTRATPKTITIWSAACSTGQEPYSIAMLLDETFPELKDWRVRIVATDLASTVLDRARQARYRQLEVNRGLPARLLVKYFDRVESEWQIKESIRRRVDFVQLNLMDNWPHSGKFDIVFLRNVLIYFDVATKQNILRRVRQVLAPDGVLFLGGAETTLHIDPAYEREQFEKSVYYRPIQGK
ncbi:MAG: protein-glutamate O-methyltransferase CheR [Polyangiaceae bacterium]